MPYLPEPLKRELLQAHKWLEDFGYPADAVRAHGIREMEWFRKYVPPGIVAQINTDHESFEAGEMPTSFI